MNSKWQWHRASALDNLKGRLIMEDQWREDGGYITVGENRWIDVTAEGSVALDSENIESILQCVRGNLGEGQVELRAQKLRFPNGQQLLDWVAEVHTEIKPGELEQQQSDTDNHGSN